MIVHQWVPAAHKGDAVGDSARRVRDLLRRMGHESELFALTIDDALQGDVRPFGEPGTREADITIFHFALPSPMTPEFAALRGRRVLQYHNITPAHFFADFDPNVFRLAWLGRRELATLVGRVDLALGDSEYNRLELETLGFRPTGVMPIAVGFDRVTGQPPCPALDGILNDGLTNLLFVGRIVPNKKIEDYIRLAEHYKRYVDSEYRFIFVGRTDGMPRYYATVLAWIDQFRMPRERFVFTGGVPEAELAAYYRAARVYISLSEHEGFCVPLLEAMAADVPVLAYASTAVPYTLGGAGVQFASKDWERVAELLALLAYDERLREQVIAGQRRRLRDFGDTKIEEALRGMIATAEAR